MPPSYVIEHLDEAIEKHWVKVHYQPIVRTITGQLCAMEGLARWDDPNWGFLTPPFFIGILEQHNLIHKLDAFLIEDRHIVVIPAADAAGAFQLALVHEEDAQPLLARAESRAAAGRTGADDEHVRFDERTERMS